MIWKLLRHLNLLEPGRRIVSISKAFMWATVFSLVWVTVAAPDQVAAIISASVASVAATANYAYRRHMQAKAPPEPVPNTEGV